MGIATTAGVIRDFAGPYYVSEDNMAFGWPTKYWTMDPYRAQGGPQAWDKGVAQASDEYRHRMVGMGVTITIKFHNMNDHYYLALIS